MRLGSFSSSFARFAFVFPVLVVSPRYFAKQITFGGLMQVTNAFCYVPDRLSSIISAYPDIVSWLAVTERLSSFHLYLCEFHDAAEAGHLISSRRRGASLRFEDLHLQLPF